MRPLLSGHCEGAHEVVSLAALSRSLHRRLLVSLLALCFALSLRAALADDPTADELSENQLVWTSWPEINPERNKEGLGGAVWGGGTFLKLISKLAIEGCDVNALIAVTPEGETMMHHFQAPSFVNRDFGEGSYLREVPRGSRIGFSCVDACGIYIGPGAGKQTPGVLTSTNSRG